MTKKTTTPKARSPRRRSTTPATQIPIPPALATIARLVDPDIDGLDPWCLEAWAAAPRTAAAYFDSTHDDRDGYGRGQFVRDAVDAQIAKSRQKREGYVRSLAAAMDALDEADPDYRTTVEIAHTEPAFYLGLALAYYLLTNGGTR